MIGKRKLLLIKRWSWLVRRGYITDAKSVLMGAGFNYVCNVIRFFYH
jgi:predicted glycosyltransferase